MMATEFDSLYFLYLIEINHLYNYVNPFAAGNLLFWQSLRISECILDTIVF